MTTSKPPAAMQQAQGFLTAKSNDFWNRLQVYPDAIWKSEAADDYDRKAKNELIKTGLANLRYLCSIGSIPHRAKEDSAEQLAGQLLNSVHRSEVIYLATFLRTRKASVVEYFDHAMTEQDKANLGAQINSLSNGRPETIKSFTKLVHLYNSNPLLLDSIHYRHAWRRLKTTLFYASSKTIKAQSVVTLKANLDSLISSFNKLKPGETYELFGTSTIDTTTVFVIHRCYPPSVRADYHEDYRLQYDFSTVVFAADEHNSSVIMKIGNRAVSDAVNDWVCLTLDVELRDPGATLFSAYQSESVESAFLGGYDEDEGIDLIQISFRNSLGPNHSPITLAAGKFSRSVREDLEWLRSYQVMRIRSLSEIEGFRMRFDGYEIEVQGIMEKGGAVRFKVNDTGITESVIQTMKKAFERAFFIPLDQSIDPTRLAMGPADIYHFLLSGISDDQVQSYQRDALDNLINLGLLIKVEAKTAHCTNATCPHHSQPVTDEKLSECPGCQEALKWVPFKKYEEDKKAQLRIVRKALEKATGWKMDSTVHSFESHKFHRMSAPNTPEQTVCVFMNDRLNSAKVEVFQRAMFPIIAVHPLGAQSLPVIDVGGIAHMGLPHMIVALDEAEDWKKYREGCRDILPRLLKMEKERVLKTSRMSFDHRKKLPAGYDDRHYEADIYNMLRSIFSFTVKWGGPNKPDGFSSLVYFPDNDFRTPKKFNWSYDAKFSETTYPFEIGEFRQMADYVRRLHKPKQLQSLGNNYDAHVIITNSMKDSAMKGAAQFMATQSRLSEDFPEFLLVFMRDSFLLTLWDRVRSAEAEFDNRGTYLSQFFVEQIRALVKVDGYCLLDDTVANQLADDVLDESAVQIPVDTTKIKKSLKKQMRPTAAVKKH